MLTNLKLILYNQSQYALGCEFIGGNLNLSEFLKYELNGWKKQEIIGLSLVFTVILLNAFLLQDSKAAVISAFCGISYTILAGKGKISCYFFGLIGTSFYSYLSLKNALYGNLILYMCYYFPMQVLGVFEWKKHLNSSTKEIIKTGLSKDKTLKLGVITVVLCILTIAVLVYFKDSSPVFDGATTVLSILGMYLTVKRCIEQWVVWMIVNGLSCLMWLNLIVHGARAYSTFVMWFVYFILAVYFFFVWKKEIDGCKNNA